MSAEDPNRLWEASVSPLGSRSDYKAVWNRQTETLDVAALAVGGFTGEELLAHTARESVDVLRYTAGIAATDVVLEIGCGIGRIGKVLACECLHWVGSDISGGMLAHAARRLADRPNTTLVELATVGLQEFPAGAFDLVYCSIVFMHLLEWDRYRYVEEAYRVLRPGGRLYIDNFQLATPSGWELFAAGARIPLDERPAHVSMSSSRDEFTAYLQRAGFEDRRIYDLPSELVAGVGRKPE